MTGPNEAAPAGKSAHASRIGTTFCGRYQITGVLGSGGMGAVFRARQEMLRREIALKVIGAHLRQHPQALERFRREAEIVASLNHPNIVTVHDFGETDDGELFLAMELIEGETLSARIRRTGPLPWGDTLPIIRSIAAALAKAHQSGIIHRDLKPDNIMLTGDGTGQVIKVLDFGVARFSSQPNVDEHGRPLTGIGVIVGSPGYLAPEALLGSSTADARGDLYGLGLIWLEMLRGRPIFDAPSPAGVLLQNAQGGTPLETLAVEVALPGALHHLLSTLLQPQPQARPVDGAAFLALLDEALRAFRGTPLPGGQVAPNTMLYGSMGGSTAPTPTDPGSVPTASGTLLYGNETASSSVTAPTPVADVATGGVINPALTQAPPMRPRSNWMAMGAVALVAGLAAAGGAAYLVDQKASATATNLVAAAARAAEAKEEAEEPTPRVVIIRKLDPDPANESSKAGGNASTRDVSKAKKARRGKRKRSKLARAKPAQAASMPAATLKNTASLENTATAPATGPLTSSAIRRGLKGNQGKALSCSNTNLIAKGHGLLVDHCPSYETLSGTHRVEFNIEPDGSVAGVSFMGAKANASSIGECVLKSLQQWDFPASSEGARKVRLPVDFSKCVPINGKCVFDS